MSEPLTRRAVSAVRITVLASIAGMLVQGLILVVLARLLTPEDYGLFALAASISRLSSALVLGSLERLLTVGPDDRRAAAPAVLHTLLVAAASAIGLAAHWLVSWLGGFPHHEWLALVVLAASFPGAFVVGARATLRRQLQFRPIVLGDLSGQILGTGLVAVLCAFAGWGAYALAAGALVQALVSAAYVGLAARHPFDLRIDLAELVKLLKQLWLTAQMTASEIANAQIPSLLVPALLGVAQLGLFNRIYALIQLPVEISVNALTRVLISGLVLVKEDRERLLRAFRKVVTLTTALASPVAAGMIACRHDLVGVVLGPQWLEGAQLVPFLAVSTWAIMTGVIFSILNEAAQLFREKTRIQVVSTLALVVAMAGGAVLFGLAGAAAGMAAASLLWLVLSMHCAGQRLETGLWEMAGWMRPGAVAALLSGAVGWSVSQAASGPISMPLSLALEVAACGLATVAYYGLFHRGLLLDILGHLGMPSSLEKARAAP
ncbi:oligosaccharide flippase family protein [Aquabacter sp. CN5-332]|uniref:oligosaccharide flippase family protein n=1 Tax=Aquabacter sp. CN5-332 TaxID=3156608 RepID=UPI0032B454B5